MCCTQLSENTYIPWLRRYSLTKLCDGAQMANFWRFFVSCIFRELKIQDTKNRQKFAICAPSHNFVRLYLRSQDMYQQLEKNLLNSNTSSTCPHNMVNFSPLTVEIGSLVWSTPANFNSFRILASLLHRHRSTEVNQTLHDVWPSPGLVHYIYVSGGSCHLTEF